jgi:hypothetical protein
MPPPYCVPSSARAQLEIVSEHTIRVTDTTETLGTAKQLIDALDATSEPPTMFAVLSDDSRIAVIRLEHAQAVDVMKALRSVLHISKVAVQQDPALVVVRDAPEKVLSARALVEVLEHHTCP